MNPRAILFGLFLFGAGIAHAIEWKTREGFGTQRLYSARTSAVSSHTVTGYGLSYNVRVVGGSADFIVKHSTSGVLNLEANVSSNVYLTDGDSINDEFIGMVVNPLILISSLTVPGATVYVDISYLAPRSKDVP